MTLKEARRLTGLSRQRLADLAGIGDDTIYDIEAGRNKRPAYDTVVLIVRALQRNGLPGLTTDELFPVPDSSEVAQ